MKLLPVIVLATLCFGCGNFQVHHEGQDREALALQATPSARDSLAETWQPRHIAYEDEYQVVAEPFAEMGL
jgi:hypothetical protein